MCLNHNSCLCISFKKIFKDMRKRRSLYFLGWMMKRTSNHEKTFATGNAGVEQKVNRIFRTRHEIDDDSIFNTETFFFPLMLHHGYRKGSKVTISPILKIPYDISLVLCMHDEGGQKTSEKIRNKKIFFYARFFFLKKNSIKYFKNGLTYHP